jgi:hypothetical protein
MPRGYSRLALPFFVVAAAALTFVALPRPQASAATSIVVTQAANTGAPECDTGGNCNLWQAINYANTVQDPVITFNQTAMGTDTIVPVPELPYFNVTSSVTIDGGELTTLWGQGAVNFGLVFLSYDGAPVSNVTVKNMYVYAFNYNPIQFCPDNLILQQTCVGEVSNVVLEDVQVGNAGTEGILFYSPNIHDVRLTDVKSHVNGGRGIAFGYVGDAGSTVHDITLERLQATYSTEGVGFKADTVDDVTDTDSYYSNNDSGFYILAEQTSDVTVTSPAYFENDSAGLDVDSGPTLTNLTVTGAEASDFRQTKMGYAIRTAGATTSNVEITDLTLNSMRDGVYLVAIVMHDITIDEVDGNTQFSPITLNPSINLSTNIAVRNSELSTMSGPNISIGGGQADIDGIEVVDNFTQGGGGGISIDGKTINNAQLMGNVLLGGGTATHGVSMSAPDGGTNNIIQFNHASGFLGDGIFLDGGPTFRVTLEEVGSNDNGGLGVDIAPDGVNPNDAGDGDTGVNGRLNFPEIEVITGDLVQGLACALCHVELSLAAPDPTNHGEGANFIASGSANADGEFAISVCVEETVGSIIPATEKFTSMATDSQGNSSEWSLNFAIPADINCVSTPTSTPAVTPPPTPTAAPTEYRLGDIDCDDAIDTQDVFLALEFALEDDGGPLGDTPLCPPANTVGDADCDDDVDEQDALRILAFVAGLPFAPIGGCPEVGNILLG